MGNVRFNLDKPREIQSLILLKYSFHGKRIRYSTGENIPPKYWNPKTHRARQSKEFPQYSDLNSYLDRLETEVLNIHRRAKREGRKLSIQELREELNIFTFRKAESPPLTMFQFIEEFIKDADKGKRKKRNGKPRSKSTISQYRVVENLLKSYKKDRKIELDFNDIDLNFYSDFIEFLNGERDNKEKGRKYSINYQGNVIKNLKTFLNAATDQGLNTNLSFNNSRFYKPREETDNIYLNVDELSKMYRYDLSNNQRLEKVRDIFIVGAFTGLRCSDLNRIKSNDIRTTTDSNGNKINLIEIVAQKTSDKVVIPLHPYVSELWKKYEGNFPRISNHKINQYIKEVGEIVGINNTVELRKPNRKLGTITRKWEEISSQTARRSFTTNAYLSGMPILSIMIITGHKTETSFMKYIKITKEENAIKMSKNKFFLTDI